MKTVFVLTYDSDYLSDTYVFSTWEKARKRRAEIIREHEKDHWINDLGDNPSDEQLNTWRDNHDGLDYNYFILSRCQIDQNQPAGTAEVVEVS